LFQYRDHYPGTCCWWKICRV